MRSTQRLLLALLLAGAVLSCSNPAESTGTGQQSSATEPAETPPSLGVQQITARFVEFSLGDAPHFLFEDESGKTWDFAGSEDPLHAFAKELPAEEADGNNQGWGSDKNLQGKWFVISYVYKKQQQYFDGPMVDAPVIVKAEPKG